MKRKLLVYLVLLFIFSGLVGCQNNDVLKELPNISIAIKEGTLTDTSATIIITDVSGDDNTYGNGIELIKIIMESEKN